MKKDKYTKARPLANLHYLFQKGKLWLNPLYQREAVWTLSQKQLFIDSLLIDIDIPKLYFREKQSGQYEFEVVDGQQRLRAVFDFFDDQFPLADHTDYLEGHPAAGLKFSELHTDLQMKLRETSLDVVTLNAAYTDEDIEETFLRLQNGTPLNAAEKRRALPGKMRDVVEEISRHKVFTDLCGFSNKRFAHEDAAAKILHLLLAGGITDIRHPSIAKTYESHRNLDLKHSAVAKASRSLNFIHKSFSKKSSPGFKKFAVITVTCLVSELLERYTLATFPGDFAVAYLDFELKRQENEELSEVKQDPQLAAYTDAARADGIQHLRYRHEHLRERVIYAIPDLELKDPIRGFSEEQRKAVFWRDKGNCQLCGTVCDESDFHVDHVKAHSLGGPTKISNAQLLCIPCNLKKSAKP